MSTSSCSTTALCAASGSPPSVDRRVIADYIRWLHDLAAGVDGDLVLSCNEQSPLDEKAKVKVFRFPVGDHEAMNLVALEHARRPWTNVFFSSYVARSGGIGRGGREDVVAVLLLGVDQDADTGKSGRLPSLSASMTIRTSSIPQINRQTFFAFDPAHRPSVEEADRVGRRLRAFCQADSGTGDINRMYRLPGTANWPTPSKTKRGRPLEPQKCFVEQEFNGYTDASALEAALGSNVTVSVTQQDGQPREITPQLDLLLRRRDIGGDRSRASWAAMRALISAGFTTDQVIEIFSKYPDGVGERYLNGARDLRADIERARRKGTDDAAVEAAREEGLEWTSLSRGDLPAPTYENTRIAMQRLGIIFRYDDYHNRLSLAGKSIEGLSGRVTDGVCARLRQMIVERFRFDPGKTHVRDVIAAMCFENTFDPVADYLASLEWDEQPRLDRWLVTYLGAADTKLNRATGVITLVGGVRRVRQPGCKFDTMLVLEGPQGSGKSTALSVLAGAENFSDQDLLSLDAKGQIENLEGRWIYEICEMQGFRKSEMSKIKAFVSRQVDRARPAYGHFSEDRQRRGIFIGTTNETEYLRDPTGNRRFLPVLTGKIDLDALQRARDQLWAEAAQREAAGESITLPRELWEQAAAEQAGRLETDGWEMILRSRLDDPCHLLHGGDKLLQKVSASALLGEYLKLTEKDWHNANYKRLATCMRRLHWDGPKSMRIGDQVVKGYERIRRDT